ncbi:MAG: hypothetical protein JRJ78_13930 [Deltaproteobacteria bacterium]|nr:hypothetical protein [Deltaproteobacteria bacterium]
MKPYRMVAPRLSERGYKFYKTLFKSLGGGCEWMLEAAAWLYPATIKGLKGWLSRQELKLILEVSSGLVVNPELAGHQLPLACDQAMSLDGLDKKHGVDAQVLLGKLGDLSDWERTCLEIWASGFWNSKAYDQEDGLNNYLKTLEK